MALSRTLRHDHAAVIAQAAAALDRAEALVIGAGAGLSVDSGIPAYRLNPRVSPNDEPPKQASLPGPLLFRHDPALAWHYSAPWIAKSRSTTPHEGYRVLHRWLSAMAAGGFVVTSNVDSQFQKAGFDEGIIVEGHGSMSHLQCVEPCTDEIWSAADLTFDGDQLVTLPRCPACKREARPNVFMFGDGNFNPLRAEQQLARLDAWLPTIAGRRLVVVECGAGTAVPTIRQKCEQLAQRFEGIHIRINPLEPQAPPGALSIPLGAREALLALGDARRASGGSTPSSS